MAGSEMTSAGLETMKKTVSETIRKLSSDRDIKDPGSLGPLDGLDKKFKFEDSGLPESDIQSEMDFKFDWKDIGLDFESEMNFDMKSLLDSLPSFSDIFGFK